MVAIADAFIRLRPDEKTFFPETKKKLDRAVPSGGIPIKATPKIDDARMRTEARRSGGKFGTFFSQSMGGGLRASIGMFSPVTAGLAGVAAGIFKATNMASDLNETISKADVIFGKNSGSVQKWAGNSVKQMGLTRQEAISNATAFGDMFQQLGLGSGVAVNMSEKLVQLAADQASFSNADITSVLEAQQAAFRGEYDSLQKYIPNINAARVQQEALIQTHKKSATELTASEKAQATYTIMLKDSVKAQGDFDRTSQGAANQQRILAAGTQEFVTQLGQYLLPLLNAAVGVGNDLLPVLGGMAKFFGELPAGIKVAAGALLVFVGGAKLLGAARPLIDNFTTGMQNLVTKGGGITSAGGKMSRAVNGVTSALKGAVFSINPVMLGLVALSAVVGYFAQKKADAKRKVEEFNAALEADSGKIGENTEKLIANRLEQEGVYKAAQQLGINLADVTLAAQGNSDAQQRVNDVIKAQTTLTDAQQRSLGYNGIELNKNRDAASTLTGALDDTNSELGDAIAKQDRLTQATPKTTEALNKEKDAAKGVKDEVKGLNEQLGHLIDKNINAASTTIDFKNKLVEQTAKVKEGGTSLGLNTQAGRDNRQMIIDLIGTAKRHGDAVAVQTGNEKKGTDAFWDQIPAIVEHSRKLGLNTQDVQNLIDRIAGLKPKSVDVTADVRAKNFTVSSSGRVTAASGQVIVPGRAYGGRVPGYSPNDFADNIVGGLAGGGTIGVTAGEYLINRRRTRALDRQAPGFLDALNAGEIRVGGDPGTTEFARGPRRLYAAGGSIMDVKNSINSKQGNPYVWGAVGPNAFDCSGLVSWAYGLLTGKGVPARYFTTDSIGAGQGFRPGLGTFTAGVTPGRGHMAGNLAGFAFEATPPSVRVGRAATPVTNFARQFFLPQVGGQFIGGPGDQMGFTDAQLHAIAQALLPTFASRVTSELADGVPRDTGGTLNPGQRAYNAAGGRERVLNAEATRQYENTHIAVSALREAISGLTLVVEGDTAQFVAGRLARSGSRGRGR